MLSGREYHTVFFLPFHMTMVRVNCLPNNVSCSNTAAVSHQIGWVTYAHLGYAWWKTFCPLCDLRLRPCELSLCFALVAELFFLGFATLRTPNYFNLHSTNNFTFNYTSTYFVRFLFVPEEVFILNYAAHFDCYFLYSSGKQHHEGQLHPDLQWCSPGLQRVAETDSHLLQEDGIDQSEGGSRVEPDW